MPAVRFTLGKQSSLAPELGDDDNNCESVSWEEEKEGEIDGRVRLMYLANEGDLEGIKELLESGTDVNFRDIDDRTALHVAACQGYGDVVDFFIKNGAEIDPKDRWGSTVYHTLSIFVHMFSCIFILVENLSGWIYFVSLSYSIYLLRI